MLAFAPEFFQAMRYEKWPRERQQEYSRLLLQQTLLHARTTTDYYHHLPDELAACPFTTKDELQRHKDRMLSKQPKGEGVWRSTSGSSGKVVHMYWDKQNLWQRFIFMYRTFAMIGLTPFKKVMYALPDKEDTGHSKILFRNAHISLRDPVSTNIAKIKNFKPHVLSIYPSYGLDIGAAAPGEFPFVQAISLNSENILDYHYKQISEYFGCPTYAEYSTVELGVVAAMCPERSLHIFTDNVYLEVIDQEGHLLPDGQSGELVATTLRSYGLPLIRYRTGDVGAIRHEHNCSCGRQAPILEHLHGRQDDYLLAKNGAQVPAWKIYEAIERPVDKDYIYRDIFISQTAPGSFDFYFTPDRDFSDELPPIIRREINRIFAEDVQINFHPTDRIPRPSTLKRKFIHRALRHE